MYSSEKAVPSTVTSAPALLLAASLHQAWGGRGGRWGETQGFRTILDTLKPESHYQQVRAHTVSAFFVSNLMKPVA